MSNPLTSSAASTPGSSEGPPPSAGFGFSLRQAFSLASGTILIVGIVFSLIILSLLLKAKREETNLRLANEAEIARRSVDLAFHEAEATVSSLASTLPVILQLSAEDFAQWSRRYADTVLAQMPGLNDLYFALSARSAKKLFGENGMVYLVAKNPKLIDDPKFNDSGTFIEQKFPDPVYLKNPREAWYHGAVASQEIHYTPLWFDSTYLQRVMISITLASRNAKTGELFGVAGVDLTAGSFARLIGTFHIGKSGGVLLLDQSGTPIAPFLNHDVPLIGFKYDPSAETSPHFAQNVKGGPAFDLAEGLREVRGSDGERYLYQVRKLLERPYYIVSYQKRWEAYSSLYWNVGTMTFLATLFMLISFFLRQKLAKFVIGNIGTILGNIESNREVFARGISLSQFWKLQPAGPREIVRLSEQLNLLYERLQSAFAEAESEKERSEQATKAKSRFLSVMSHEIRTPLNSMLGLTDILLLSPLNSEQIRHLQVLQRSGQSLLRILNDILDFSRLEAGKLQIEAHEFDLFELLYDIESLMRFDAEAKGLLFRVTAPGYNYRLFGDSIRIRQAVLNLVGNAIKFTAKGAIDVRVSALPEAGSETQKFKFEIADSGIGMSVEAQAKIFSEFSQADASITRRYGGTGLGLVISRQIIDLLGGDLALQSEPGKGSTLTFTIPLIVVRQEKAQYQETSADRLTGSAPLRKPSAVTQSLKPDTRVRVSETRAELPPRPENTSSSETKSILVVDDDDDNHRLIEAYINFRNNLRAEHAFSGREALAKLEKSNYALILMDMQMPEMDGLDTIQEIRRRQKAGEIAACPIVMLSANTFEEDQQKSLAAGADEHIAKPIKLERFNDLVKRWMS